MEPDDRTRDCKVRPSEIGSYVTTTYIVAKVHFLKKCPLFSLGCYHGCFRCQNYRWNASSVILRITVRMFIKLRSIVLPDIYVLFSLLFEVLQQQPEL